MSRAIIHKDAHIPKDAQIGGFIFFLPIPTSRPGWTKPTVLHAKYCTVHTYTLKCTGVSHLDITESTGSYCASTVFICVLIYFQNVCLIYIHFPSLSMNRNICFSMHWNSLRDVVINVSHLAQAHLHSLDMLLERCNHIIQIHVFVY